MRTTELLPRAKRGPASCGPTPVIAFPGDGDPLRALPLTRDDGRSAGEVEIEIVLSSFMCESRVGRHLDVGDHVFAGRSIRLGHPELRARVLFDTVPVPEMSDL